MAKIEFSKNLEEFTRKVNEVDKTSPDKIYKSMDKLGNKVKKELKEATPRGGGRKTIKKRMSERWTASRTEKKYGTYDKGIRNTAPHYHLVERGHRLVKNGKEIGYVDGQRFTEKTLERLEPEIERDMEDIFDKLVGDLFD